MLCHMILQQAGRGGVRGDENMTRVVVLLFGTKSTTKTCWGEQMCREGDKVKFDEPGKSGWGMIELLNKPMRRAPSNGSSGKRVSPP